jgi:phosphate transport system permease protein
VTSAPPAAHPSLTGRRLPRRAAPAAALVAVAGAAGLAVVSPVSGTAGTAVVAGLLFLVGYTGWSFAVEGRRHAIDRLATTLIYACFVVAIVPLVWILGTVVVRGSRVLSPAFLTHSMRGVSSHTAGGGVYHALIGTVEQVLLASAMAVPVGILTAVYLVEYGRHSRLTRAIGFFVDVMTGVPSIISGLFVYTAFVLSLGLHRTGLAGSLALAILMIPVVVRSTEEMLKIVPMDLREASYALGIPKWRTIVRVVIPTALGGIATGVMLAIARISGETAPLLLTTFLSQSINFNPTSGPQASIPTFVWDQIGSGTHSALDRAWAGALVLIVFVAVLYVGARLIAWYTGGRNS